MNRTDLFVRTLTEEERSKQLVKALSNMTMSLSVLYEVDDDVVLGIICTLVKANLSGKEKESERKKLKDINARLNALFGIPLEDLDNE